MSRENVIKQFRFIYPENEIHIVGIHEFKDKAIVTANFPDGRYFFVVDEHSVSYSYDTFDRARAELV